MRPNKGQQRDRIQILRKEVVFQRVVSTAGNQDILPNTVQMWRFKGTHELCCNRLISLTDKTKLKLVLVEPKDLEGPSYNERSVL